MQSLGDSTLADFMKTNSISEDVDILCSRSIEKLGATTRSKRCAIKKNENDIAKYFNDSLIIVSGDANGSKENDPPGNLESMVIPDDPVHKAIVYNPKPILEKYSNNTEGITLPIVDSDTSNDRAKKKKSSTIKKKYSQLGERLGKVGETISRLPGLSEKFEASDEHPGIETSSKMLENCSPQTLAPNNENSTSHSREKSSNQTTNSCIEVPAESSMLDSCKLANWGLPLTILRKYEARGVTSMFPWQANCLSNRDLLEKNRNLVYSAPTSAGKTLVAEIMMIKTVLERRKKVIFILPFVSVVREKMYYFQDLLSDSGVRVEGFMGGCAPAGGFAATDVAIATIEKANSLLNQLMEEGNIANLGAVVIDELHLIGDSHRGYLLELLLTKLKYMTLRDGSARVQLIGMSATLPNLGILAKWLNAELYKTDFRPVPLNELCKIGKTIYDNQMKIYRELSNVEPINGDSDNIIQLCIETITDGHSVLIFCPTKNWSENLGQQIARTFSNLGRQDSTIGRNLRLQLSAEAITETLEQLKRCPIGLDAVLKNTVSFGVAFHHAGLTMDEREIVEGAFRGGSLRVLTATSTLSSGVNLPARRVIIRSMMFHGKPLDALTYRQMIGRAGRMGKDTAGESILVCKPNEKKSATGLLSAQLEPIESCLDGPGLLMRALLEVVASEVAYTADDIDLYVKCALASSTNPDLVKKSTTEAMRYLVDNELLMIQKTSIGDVRWVATALGKACLAASVPPRDGLFLFDELQKARRCFVLDTELHVIYLVTPLNSSNQIGQIDWIVYLDLWKSISESDRRVGQLVGVEESFIMAAIRGIARPGKNLDVHKRFYTALALHELVREVSLAEICRKYGFCRGVVQGLQQSAATFAGMVTQFCKKLGWNCMELLIGQFQGRLQFGVCRELLDLLRLPMLNGLRARSLYREGITSVPELAIANELDVERALHKALPFESGKEHDGEHEIEARRRNKMRSVFVTGRDGLTPRDAAIILVREARTLVQNELGLDELQWNNRESSIKTNADRSETAREYSSKSSSVCNSIEKNISKIHIVTDELRNYSGADDYLEKNYKKQQKIVETFAETEESSPTNSKNSESSEKICQIEKIDEEIFDFTGQIEIEREEKMLATEKFVGHAAMPKTVVARSSKIIELPCEGAELNSAIAIDSKFSQTFFEIERNNEKTDEAIDNEEIFDFTGEIKIKTKEKILDNEKFVDDSPAIILLRESASKASESRSPSMFGDSLNLDTQECNMLERNVIDSLNISVFGDTNFSETAETRNNTPDRRSSDFTKPICQQKIFSKNTCSRRSSEKLELNNRSKSIVWHDDSWNNTNGVIETMNLNKNSTSRDITDDDFKKILQKKRIVDNSEAIISKTSIFKIDCDVNSVKNSRLTELRKLSQKRKLKESNLEKSPIASVRAYAPTRRLSVDSNKSDSDDVIMPSQGIELPISATKNRTRLKLESLRRSRTQRAAATTTTPATAGPTRSDATKNFNNSDDKFCGTDNVVDNSDDEAPAKRAHSTNSTSFARPAGEFFPLTNRVPERRKIATDKSRNKNSPVKKINDPQIANVTSNLAKFNIFKRELVGRTDISLALGCKSFLENTVSIGTKIIGVTGIDGGKKSKKIENCVHGNKKLCGVAISWDGLVVHYISFDNNQDTKVPVKDRLNVLTEILGNQDITIRCFSFKETYKMLYNCCKIASSCKFYDPTIADWLLDPDRSERSFDALINEHLSEGKYLLQRIGVNIGNGGPGFNVNSAMHTESRATTEAALTWHVMNRLMRKLEKRSPTLLQTFKEVEMGTVALLARMELNGIGVNLKSLQELSDVIQREMMQLEEKAYYLAGKKFNFSSSKSVAQILGLYKGKKVSTKKAALENCENPISSLVISWRKLSTTQIKIVFPLLRLAECNSRVYGNCLTNTATGRISMHEPNLQNVPRDFDSQDGSFVVSVRMAFAPIIGNVILSADYCQLELRILAHFSKEPNLCRILRKEGDVFRNIAARWYNVAEEKIDEEMRHTTKQLCYGMIYGMGVKTLAETLSVTEDEAKKFLETFMNAYPGIRPWLSRVIDQARMVGYVKTLMHRRRFFPSLDSQVPSERGQAERQVVNTKVQGSAADIAKKAMVAIDESLRRQFPDSPLVFADAPIKRKLRSHSREPLPRGGFLILQIHDELLYEVNASDLHQVAKIIQESMENSCSLRVPLPVKLKIGPTWGDLTEYKCQS